MVMLMLMKRNVRPLIMCLRVMPSSYCCVVVLSSVFGVGGIHENNFRNEERKPILSECESVLHNCVDYRKVRKNT